MDSAMNDAANVYFSFGRPSLLRMGGPDSPFLTVTPAQFEAGQYDFCGFERTKVRTARTLALMRRAVGEFEASRGFARIALANLGRASGLKRELEQLAGESV